MLIGVLILGVLVATTYAGNLNNGQVGYASVQQHPSPPVQNIAPPVRPVATTIGIPVVETRIEPFDPHPQYSYSYAVNDPQTGDVKSQHEVRNGNVVRGQYSLTDPDGSQRIVDYAADEHHGFNALVQRTRTINHN